MADTIKTNNDEILPKSQEQFNNASYFKKWYTYCDETFIKKCSDINFTNKYVVGEPVAIFNEKYKGDVGKIGLGFSDNPDEICIKLKGKENSKIFVDKSCINKISYTDYFNF